MSQALRVAVTGAAGQIGYALVFRIATGGLFGPEQKVRLQLLEVPQAENALQGVVMELRDGHILRWWDYWDMQTLMNAAPTRSPAPAERRVPGGSPRPTAWAGLLRPELPGA